MPFGARRKNGRGPLSNDGARRETVRAIDMTASGAAVTYVR